MNKEIKYWFYFYGEDETPDPDPVPPGDKEPMFTQEQVNTFNKKERLAKEAAIKERDQLLERLTQTKDALDEKSTERQEIEAELLAIKEKGLSEVEKAQRTIKEREKELEKIREEKEKEVISWKRQFESKMVETDILQAANSEDHRAYNAQQFLDYMKNKTEVVEIKDDDGKGTGKYQTLASFMDIDPDDKAFLNALPVGEAVKRMSALPKMYGNLFLSGAISGLELEGSKVKGSKNKVDVKNPKKYREARKKDPEAFGVGRSY